MSRCLIFGSAPIADIESTRQFIREDDFVICADGGYHHAKKLGILVNLLVGDFDSFQGALPSDIEQVRFAKEKDQTDLFLAVTEACKRGYQFIFALGVLDGRTDHTFANMQMMASFLKKNVYITLANGHNMMYLLMPGSYTFQKGEFPYISFFSFMQPISNLTLQGFKYPLNNYKMLLDDSVGISNVIEAEIAEVSFDEGILLVMHSKESAR